MKKILFTLASLLSCIALGAQSLDGIRSSIASNEFTLDYTYVVNRDFSLKGSGTLTLNSAIGGYRLSGDGLRVWCNGSTKWTVDDSAREVVIESEDRGDYASSPARILFSLGEDFALSSSSPGVLVLSPTRNNGISKVTLRFAGGTTLWSLSKVEVLFSDSTYTEFTVSNFRNLRAIERGSAASYVSSYSLDAKSLGPSWVVTDLR